MPRTSEIASQPLVEKTLVVAITRLCKVEPRFQAVVDNHGIPSLRAATGGLEGLLMIVTEQFLSLAAAKAIWTRLVARLHPFDAQHILACPAEELLELGLSRAKAKSFQGLAQASISGDFNAAILCTLDDDSARKHLLALPGVGPWTADVYMLSCLLRPDAWPWGDVALQNAAQDLFAFNQRPDKPAMIALGENFKPYRAVAARLLWAHYRGMKAMPQA